MNKLHKFALMGLLCVNWASAQDAQAQSTQGSVETDCTDTTVDYSSTETMTQAEKIAAMDRALNQSLNKYDACVSETSNQSSANGGGEGSGGGGGGEGQGEGEAAQGQSTEAAGISGTSAPPTSQAAAETIADEETKTTENPVQHQQGLVNGKIPEDIPPENNDDILAQRIRSAAEAEPDPDKQARLWNEYRKYKGLPQK